MTGARRALGSLLLVDARWPAGTLSCTGGVAGVAVLPLPDAALLVTTLAKDGLRLRQRLDNALDALHA